MVRHTLCEAIQRVESMACVWGRHDPFVMGFVKNFVNLWVVQASVDPVDEEIGKDNKQGELQVVIEGKWLIGQIVVEFSVATDLAEKEGRGENSHDWERIHGLAYFEGDLVLEIFRVGKCGVVEDEDIG